MKIYKVKDLYIIRPIKLIKQKQNIKFAFPYNIYYKLGFLSDKRLDAGVNYEKSTYNFQAKDISIATLDRQNKSYYDIINDKNYLSYKYNYLFPAQDYQRAIDELSQIDNLIIRENVLDTDLLSIFLSNKNLNNCPSLSFSYLFNRLDREIKRIESENLSLDALCEFRDMLVSEIKDKTLSVCHEWTQTYKEPPLYEKNYSHDIHGKKIKPIDNIYIKEKILIK